MPNPARSQLAYLGTTLEELKQQHRYFHLRVLAGEQKPVATFDGKKVINLSSNNYLGLASHPKLRAAALAAIRKYGVGAGAVRTISGTMRIHMDLERQIAKFKHTEACVVFQSGFTANAGTVAAILGKDDLIISDELNHASIIDGCRLSKAAIRVFQHKDTAHCAKICEETKDWPGHKLLITDGVFSMDGDVAPLPALCDLAEKYNCIMMVDDAHSSGVLGHNGRGTVDHLGCHGRVDIQVGTLSKAIGAMGGYVCGSQELIEFLYHRARPFLFSTSHPPSVTATCQAAFTLLASRAGAELVEKLWGNTRYFQKGLTQQGFPPSGSETPISPILVGEAAKAFELTGELFKQGVFAPAVGFPTVPEGKARLRAIVTATHTRRDLEKALDILGRVARKLAIIH